MKYSSAAAARRAGLVVPETRQAKSERRVPAVESPLEATLAAQLKIVGLPAPRRQVKASELGIPIRLWVYDFGWPQLNCVMIHGRLVVQWLLVEVSGGTWVKSAHSTGRGIARDYAKANAAVVAGHVVLTFDGDSVRSGEAVSTIRRVLIGY